HECGHACLRGAHVVPPTQRFQLGELLLGDDAVGHRLEQSLVIQCAAGATPTNPDDYAGDEQRERNEHPDEEVAIHAERYSTRPRRVKPLAAWARGPWVVRPVGAGEYPDGGGRGAGPARACGVD